MGHLFTRSNLTHPEVFFWSSLVPSAFWGLVFISLGNLSCGIRFICCIQFLLWSTTLSKTRVIFNSFAISVFVLRSVKVYRAVLFVCLNHDTIFISLSSFEDMSVFFL
jgi:hypothetical protein